MTAQGGCVARLPKNELELMTMIRNQSSALTPLSDIIDAVMDRYVSWREESAAVEAAYHAWRGASRDQSRVAFHDYSAALDREEHAAYEYRRLIELAGAA
jgi:hypothetical protein